MKDIYTVFDNMQENFNEVNEMSLSEVDIDKQRIKEGIFSELNMKQHKKKHFSKKLAVTLIAATLAIGILSTSVIAAMGTLKPAFGEIFSGDLNASHLYSGGNVRIHSEDDNLNVELLGVSGDDTTAYAAIQLTKKDGTSFVQSDKSILSIPSVTSFGESDDGEYMDYHNYHTFDEDKLIVSTEKNLRQLLTQPHTSGSVSYSVNGWEFLLDSDTFRGEDKAVKIIAEDGGKILKMYVKIINNTISPKGRSVTISCKEISEYVPVKFLKTFDRINDETDKYIQLNYGKNKIDSMFIDSGDNSQYDLWQVTDNKIALPFEVSFKLNYKSDVKTVELDEKTAKTLYFLHDFNDNATVTLSSFGMNISSYQARSEEFPIFDGKNTKITMKDGTVYRVLKTVQKHINDHDITILEYRKDDGTVDFDNMNHLDYSDAGWNFVNADIDIIDIDSIDTLQINDCIIKINP